VIALAPRPAKEGHRAHELNYTPELQKCKSAAELHNALARLIKK